MQGLAVCLVELQALMYSCAHLRWAVGRCSLSLRQATSGTHAELICAIRICIQTGHSEAGAEGACLLFKHARGLLHMVLTPMRAIVDGLLCPPPLSQVNNAVDNMAKESEVLTVLLCIEGAVLMLVAVGVLVRLLGSISVHRQALFSVFLAIPNTYLRTLASKSVSIGDEDADSEDGEGDLAVTTAVMHYVRMCCLAA